MSNFIPLRKKKSLTPKIELSHKETQLFNIISNCASKLGFEVLCIGGFVRDKILGRPVKDIDFVTDKDGIALALEVAKSLGQEDNIHVFKNFGTAMLRYDDMDVEFVGARKESYSDDSRNPQVEPGTLEDDQKRRDFTINALAINLVDLGHYSEIVDPFGGIQDLKDGIIRTPLSPDKTFSDDPLRMLRAIRFSNQLNFTIEEKTFASFQEQADRIKIVSAERIITELNKIMQCPKPSVGLKLLEESTLLQRILPELSDLKGVAYIEGVGHKDNFYHTLEVIDNVASVSDNIWLRWAALFHDIAKTHTKKYENGGWTFHGHEMLGAALLPKIFRRLRLPLDHKLKYVQQLVRLHLRPISLTKENITDAAIRRLIFDAGESLEDLMILCKADITSKNESKKKRFLDNYRLVEQKMIEVEERDRIRTWQPPISGDSIMEFFGLKPCKEVGILKNALKDAILDGNIPNEVGPAYEFITTLGAELGLKPKSN
ncbi:MAG: HD domain-containing protein [Saprospiraceae bacterium]|nr:HD domain-containing protein [Saprospiraceae bacterium]